MAIEKIISNSTSENTPSLDKSRKTETPDKVGSFEKPTIQKDKEKISADTKIPSALKVAAPITAPAWQAQRARAIDKILSEGLNEVFLKMKPAEQAAFKFKGEETVFKINTLLSQTKVKFNKIISLIRDWLKMIPGINHFFLEQEVKIKADRIVQLKDKF